MVRIKYGQKSNNYHSTAHTLTTKGFANIPLEIDIDEFENPKHYPKIFLSTTKPDVNSFTTNEPRDDNKFIFITSTPGQVGKLSHYI